MYSFLCILHRSCNHLAELIIKEGLTVMMMTIKLGDHVA